MGKLILVTSGKGGAGKSSVTCGLGAALCRRGNRVLLVDTDEGLRTLDIMLGLSSQMLFDLEDVFKSRCNIEAAARHVEVTGYENLDVIAAPLKTGAISGDFESVNTKLKMAEEYDYVLIDSPAGIDKGFLTAAAGMRDAIVVVTPDPVCVRISASVREALVRSGTENMRVIINKFSTKLLERGVIVNIDQVIDESAIQLLGVVPEDKNVQASAAAGKPLEQGAAARAFDRIAARLDGEHIPIEEWEL